MATGGVLSILKVMLTRSVLPAVSLLPAQSVWMPSVRTYWLGARYGHGPAGRSLNEAGGLAGSSTHRVWVSPEPPLSLALTVGLTANTYQPFTSGVAGSSVMLVTGRE